MSDQAALNLNEAVEEVAHRYAELWEGRGHWPAMMLTVEFARRYAAGTRLMWCETHDSPQCNERQRPHCQVLHKGGSYHEERMSCSIVEKWITDPLEGT